MERVQRRLTDDEKKQFWESIKDGASISDVGRALGISAGAAHNRLSARGGIPPPPRRRRESALTFGEREEISRGLEAGSTFTAIAQKLGRAASTISREVRRNGGQEHYRALEAEACAHKAALRPKECKLAKNGRLRRFVAEKLLCEWSPEQISGALRRQFREASMRVSHETIYRSLFVQARGVLKKELTKHLRTRRIMRRSKNATTKGQPRGQIVGAISISERPSAIEDRAVPGHWEGDLISGSNNTHIATLVERYSRFVMLVKVGGKDAETVAAALTKAILKLPQQLRGSLTWDRGSEMAQHQKITIATDVKVYFCDPSSPWQRGSNENTNGLLRQYFPKGTDLSGYTQRELNEIAKRLNQRPRKTLDFRTPADALEQALH